MDLTKALQIIEPLALRWNTEEDIEAWKTIRKLNMIKGTVYA
jgi:hypothetical protein